MFQSNEKKKNRFNNEVINVKADPAKQVETVQKFETAKEPLKLKETLKDKNEILYKKSKEIFAVRNRKKINHNFKIYFDELKRSYFKAQKKVLIKQLKKIANT